MPTRAPALITSLTLAVAASSLPGTLAYADPASTAANSDWIELFNGKDLDAWSIKIQGSELGENPLDTFRVADGLLQIRYDHYQKFPEENAGFGHIFYTERAFSHYILEVEYRFVGEQVTDGPAWAYRNNGMMYHTQAPETMALDQDFPLSVEYQLLGGNGTDERSTANLCTPATQVVMDGELRKDHCINSSSKTYHGDQWVTVQLEVHGSELAVHRVNGEPVMQYTNLQLDDGTAHGSGYIALQAESAPTDFRRVRLLNLAGCMDKTANNYREYFIKNNADSCLYDG
ncbi:3-keto-disaccharide hydrolase [Gilvimarinus agarilyticus]|uniref:3-keto-disaccharide hydrolase n=1 Tax=Gilvimarinus agarilyticus TaxID=679259 RepID=UPI0006986E10|nr:DUF1080 domain-containing protein [Gilvimarinus agarilyticus]